MLDTVRVMLRYGADVNGLDQEGWNPLHVVHLGTMPRASRNSHFPRMGALALGALTVENPTAEDWALGAGFDAEVQHLLQRRGNVDRKWRNFSAAPSSVIPCPMRRIWAHEASIFNRLRRSLLNCLKSSRLVLELVPFICVGNTALLIGSCKGG